MRGYDDYLVSRTQRAGNHYFDDDTLRFFNAYGGASALLHSELDGKGEPRRLYALVESVRFEATPREYRPVFVLFTPDTDNGGETVEIIRPFDNVATGKTAERIMRDHLADMAILIADCGYTIDDAVKAVA